MVSELSCDLYLNPVPCPDVRLRRKVKGWSV
jgi:hypothetical protein